LQTVFLFIGSRRFSVRVFAFGGGIQSMAVMVLAARGQYAVDHFLFCNVGADSENPATLDYVQKVVKPYAENNGLDFVELFKYRRDGSVSSVLQSVLRAKRFIPIPVYMSTGAPGRRACTVDFKIRVLDSWVRARASSVILGLGISIDEFWRSKDIQWHVENGIQKRREYPLIERRLTRTMCRELIMSEGLLVPDKSSCLFCPFHGRNYWLEFRRRDPVGFASVVDLEDVVNGRRACLGKDKVFIHRDLIPLSALSENVQLPLFEEVTSCDEGVCDV
jgi:hypothetical protein